MLNQCFFALGANLPTATDTPLAILRQALQALKAESFDLREVSYWYSTPAFPKGAGADFVNAVAHAQTRLSPRGVMDRLAQTELNLGRTREKRWGARVCDLDLISYGDTILPDLATYTHWRDLSLDDQMSQTPAELILPHPRLQDRAFVLVPLRDVAPNWSHPVTGQSLDTLISQLPPEDVACVKRLQFRD